MAKGNFAHVPVEVEQASIKFTLLELLNGPKHSRNGLLYGTRKCAQIRLPYITGKGMVHRIIQSISGYGGTSELQGIVNRADYPIPRNGIIGRTLAGSTYETGAITKGYAFRVTVNTILVGTRMIEGGSVNELERRIVEISFKFRLTHVSSCLNCVNLIDWIYEHMQHDDVFVLDNGHASLAHFVVLEKNGYCNAEEMVTKHGTHASNDPKYGIYVSNGSLGQAATVAVGMALADKSRTVWLVTSDGSTMEGATHEAIRVGAKFCLNLKVFIVFNGYGAYQEISHGELPTDGKIYYVDQTRYPSWLRGLDGHYLQLSQEQYDELMA